MHEPVVSSARGQKSVECFEQFRCPRGHKRPRCTDADVTESTKRPPSQLTKRQAPVADKPFISATTRWRERFTSVTQQEFDDRAPAGQCERPLRLLLIGHNPSEHSHTSGTSYSNPSNRFWPTMRMAGFFGTDWRPSESWESWCNNMPGELGIGISEVLTQVGSDANVFDHSTMLRWREDFYGRLRGHTVRAGSAPRTVMFVGKRQWAHLFPTMLPRVPSGLQTLRPPGWPLPRSTKVFVVTSPSGRAVISTEARTAEYVYVREFLDEIMWPFEEHRKCVLAPSE